MEDLQADLSEFAFHPLWRNIFEAFALHTEDLKTYAANSTAEMFQYNKGLWHGALALESFLREQLEKYKG